MCLFYCCACFFAQILRSDEKRHLSIKFAFKLIALLPVENHEIFARFTFEREVRFLRQGTVLTVRARFADGSCFLFSPKEMQKK